MQVHQYQLCILGIYNIIQLPLIPLDLEYASGMWHSWPMLACCLVASALRYEVSQSCSYVGASCDSLCFFLWRIFSIQFLSVLGLFTVEATCSFYVHWRTDQSGRDTA